MLTSLHKIKAESMELRDYFAAQVLNGFQARDDFDDIADFAVVKRCYEIADQMMKAREEK